MFKIGVKLQIIPPNAQHKSAPLVVIKKGQCTKWLIVCILHQVATVSKENIPLESARHLLVKKNRTATSRKSRGCELIGLIRTAAIHQFGKKLTI